MTVEIASLSGATPILKRFNRTFTDAEIKALPTTPITLINSPGVGQIIVPTEAHFSLTSVAGYTNFGAPFNVDLSYAAPSVSSYALGTAMDVFFGSAANIYTVAFPTPANISFIDANAPNTALRLKFDNAAAGNLTGGNAANHLNFTLLYYIAAS